MVKMKFGALILESGPYVYDDECFARLLSTKCLECLATRVFHVLSAHTRASFAMAFLRNRPDDSFSLPSGIPRHVIFLNFSPVDYEICVEELSRHTRR